MNAQAREQRKRFERQQEEAQPKAAPIKPEPEFIAPGPGRDLYDYDAGSWIVEPVFGEILD